MSDLASLEKKRRRDRRAQNAARARRDAHVQALEAQVELCHREHGQQRLGQKESEETCVLRAALSTLHAEHEEVRPPTRLCAPAAPERRISGTIGNAWDRDPDRRRTDQPGSSMDENATGHAG